jgi:hypothetical protein
MPEASKGHNPDAMHKTEQYFGQSNSAMTNSAIEYSGQTMRLTAQTNVLRKSYIKLVIADGGLDGEEMYLIHCCLPEAGSFVSKIDLGQDKLNRYQ